VLAAVAALGAAAVGGGPAGASAPRGDTAARSKVVATELTSVSVAPHSTTAYVLGTKTLTVQGDQKDFVLRSKGHGWKSLAVHTPPLSAVYSVAAGGRSSAWAVGGYGSTDSPLPLVLHSTGGDFRKVKGPAVGSGDLVDVSASSPSNVWVVGTPPPFSGARDPLVGHWNGHRWKAIPDPDQRGDNLFSVTTTGARNTWMLGNKTHSSNVGFWDGTSLTVSDLPLPPHGAPQSIATGGPHNTWVVGWFSKHRNSSLLTMTLHWNGKRWKRFAAPSPSADSQAVSVTMAGKQVYLCGQATPKFGEANRPYIARFVHGHWVSVKTDRPKPYSPIYDISVSSKRGVAVGSHDGTYKGQRTQRAFLEVKKGNRFVQI
jgi:hypothetical protein